MAINHSRALSVLAATAVIGLLATSCTSTSPKTGQKTKTLPIERGGVYRVGVSSFGNTDNLDPTGEYGIPGWGVLDALQRTLVTFRFAPGSAGTVLVPDLATSIPQPSPDGLTYTFHLKPGIKFGPPLNREITSSDVAYAFERINTKPLVAQYGFYYAGVIRGMTGNAPRPEPISGIQTPDPSTIVFHLTRPTGDFLFRLTLPATAPIPSEIARCFSSAGGYGRDVVSSGPYMIEGAQAVNPASCKTISPMSGYDPARFLNLVRNPAYNPATDTASGRKNYVNGIQISIDTSIADIFDKVQAGTLDASWYDQPPAVVLHQYLTNPSLRNDLHAFPNGNVQFIEMNLTHPPFDDIHVRKAVSYIIDKAALQRAWGGPTGGQIATHIVPPFVLHNQLASYNPYATPGNSGDLQKAMAEMKLSTKYDPKQDGKCDVAACTNLVLVNQNITPWSTMEPVIVQDLAKIGIQVTARDLETGAAYNTVQTLANDVPISMNANWAYDYVDAYTYLFPMFDSQSITTQGNPNTSLTGLTAGMAKQFHVLYPAGGVPSVDQRINACEAQTGTARVACWTSLDQYLMEDVVPLVPYLWSNVVVITGTDVTHFEADPISQGTTFTQVAVSNHVSMNQ